MAHSKVMSSWYGVLHALFLSFLLPRSSHKRLPTLWQEKFAQLLDQNDRLKGKNAETLVSSEHAWIAGVASLLGILKG